MADRIEIWIVISIAAVMVIASLVLTSFAGARKHAKRDKLAFSWLGATNIAFLLATMGLMLGQLLPFWIAASMVILGMLLGMIVGYISLMIGAGAFCLPQRYIVPALALAFLQGCLALLMQDLAVLVISSSLINGLLGLLLAWRLWAKAVPHGRELALLASAPFAAIGGAYLIRLALALMQADDITITVMTLVITFLMAFSALQWGFVLIAFRATRLNASLEIARNQAEDSSRLKSRLLANMSHELRTPLNGILGMTQALQGMSSDPEHLRMLDTIRDSGDGLMTVLNNILDLSKVQSGQMQLETRPFDLAELLESVTTPFAVMAQAKGISFDLQVSLEDAPLRIGDELRVRQILGNLLSNAVKFTEAGFVACTVTAQADAVCMTVSDSGIGMTPEQQARLFDEFTQADASITRRFGGTGLGMPIVRDLTEMLGGQVVVTSEAGRGTIVDVRLPLPVAPVANLRAEDGPALPDESLSAGFPDLQDGATSPRTGLQPAAHHIRVLVAEDNRVNQKVLIALMRDMAVDLTLVDNGRLALERARAQEFDLFLFDVMMPEMDGVSALGAIAAELHVAGRPVPPAVVITANVAPEQIADYLAAGFAEVIAKPISKLRLISILSRLGFAAHVGSGSEKKLKHDRHPQIELVSATR